MGKGLPASVFASSLRTLVRALAHPCVSPAHLLSELNDLMFEQLSSADIFITAQLVLADLRQRHLSIASAGHCPLLISSGSYRTCALAPDAIPLGIQKHSVFFEQLAPLEPFGSVLLYTDGLTEARNSSGDFFGQSRLETWFTAKVGDGASAAQLKEGLLDELRSFQAGKRPVDDQTFVVLSDETPRTALNLAQHVQVDVALLAA
jgi:sigma-B regulation protein RsbU (phosphoserine phosphatase)